MPILFFMPWVACAEPQDLDALRLVPYVRGAQPGTHDCFEQATLDTILSGYGESDFYPEPHSPKYIEHATLLSWSGGPTVTEWDSALITSRLVQAQYVTFAALAKRRFASHLGYCNSDGYRAIAQCFDAGAPGDTASTVRRRDGWRVVHVQRPTAPRFIRPQHVDSGLRMDIDAPLAAALLQIPPGDLKDRVDASIDLYVKANTDSSSMSERTELVLMRVALETLLNATHHAADLRKRFEDHFAQDLPAAPKWYAGEFAESIWRKRWAKDVKRPVDAWLQDFCASRNAAAHGPGHHLPPVWAAQNHLLFASWLFVLMVKKLLAEKGLYALSVHDQALRRGFEAFFAHDLLGRVDEDAPELWWSCVERHLLWDIEWKATFGF